MRTLKPSSASRCKDPQGHAQEVDALIDTGFNGFLTLPPAVVTALGLTRRSRGRAQLANGREEVFDIYGVTVLWDGQPQYVEAAVLILAINAYRAGIRAQDP